MLTGTNSQKAIHDINYICDKHGINQSILGQILGISRQTFTNWKRLGIPRRRQDFIDTLKSIENLDEYYVFAEDHTEPNILRKACLEYNITKRQLASMIGRPVGVIERAWFKEDRVLPRDLVAVGKLVVKLAKLEKKARDLETIRVAFTS